MDYKIESIGASFSKGDIKQLESQLSVQASEGYLFHSVFQVQKTGCMGIGKPEITYLAVFVRED